MEPLLSDSSIEKDFLDSLPLSQQCTEEEEELLHFLFENKLKKVEKLYFYVLRNKLGDILYFCYCQQIQLRSICFYYAAIIAYISVVDPHCSLFRVNPIYYPTVERANNHIIVLYIVGWHHGLFLYGSY